MTRKGASKPVGHGHDASRLQLARAYLRQAGDGLDLLEAGEPANPVISHIGLAAIGYSDAVTARFLGRVNQIDHAGLPKLLRDALGNQLPDAQMRRLRRILQEKDETQYGARLKSREEAQRLFEDLQRFAQWAEDVLAG